MKQVLLEKRKYYFIFLFSSFVYIGLLILIIKNPAPFSLTVLDNVILGIGALVPAFLFFLRKTAKEDVDKYKKILVLGHLPLLIGFFLSLLKMNLMYFLVMFPVFVLGYLIIIPKE